MPKHLVLTKQAASRPSSLSLPFITAMGDQDTAPVTRHLPALTQMCLKTDLMPGHDVLAWFPAASGEA